MIVQSFRSVMWVGAVAGAAISCYMVSLRVAAERASLESVETRILMAKRDIRALDTELSTRGRLRQLERWNVDVLALIAPTEGQFLEGEVQLAGLAASTSGARSDSDAAEADAAPARHAVREASAPKARPGELRPRPILAEYRPGGDAAREPRLLRASVSTRPRATPAPKREARMAIRTASKTAAKTGSKTAAKTGSKVGAKTVSMVGAKTASKVAGRTGTPSRTAPRPDKARSAKARSAKARSDKARGDKPAAIASAKPAAGKKAKAAKSL